MGLRSCCESGRKVRRYRSETRRHGGGITIRVTHMQAPPGPRCSLYFYTSVCLTILCYDARESVPIVGMTLQSETMCRLLISH